MTMRGRDPKTGRFIKVENPPLRDVELPEPWQPKLTLRQRFWRWYLRG
jgi:hypothetical protein